MEELTTAYKSLTNIYISPHEDAIKKIQDQREKILKTDNIFTETKQYSSLQDLKKNLEDGRFSIDINDAHYECLFHYKPSKTLYVIFDGARLSSRMPNFPRWTYHNLFDGSYIGIEDPMYFKYPNLKIGWYYGTDKQSYIKDSLLIIKTICNAINIPYENIIFFSSSGGGYASIYASSLINNSLSISINPQIILSNYHYIDTFTKISGISPDKYDIFNRNDLIECIKSNKQTKHLIICNVQDTHHFENHIIPLATQLSIPIKYGLSSADNVLLWIYNNDGAPNPHTAFETKAIYSIIDYIAKYFKKNKIDRSIENLAISINEIWNEIYIEKKKNMSDKTQYYLLLEDSQILDPQHSMGETYNIKINKNLKKYNHFKLDLPQNSRHSILINSKNIKSSSSLISIILFDFSENKTIYRTDKDILSDINLNIIIGNKSHYGICIYAGLQGATQNQYLIISNLEHRIQLLNQ